jgi:hypothetical protein
MGQALVEPFFLTINLEGQEYQARVTYTKSGTSCLNVFEVEMIEPDWISVVLASRTTCIQGR